MAGRVIYLVRSWPRLSQTFIVNEILALERRGVQLSVFALVRSGETLVQPQVHEVRAPVRYLEPSGAVGRLPRWLERTGRHLSVAGSTPVRYASALLYALRRPGLAAGYGECSTVQCFDHAVQVAAAVAAMERAGERPTRVHAHFAHDPALVGLLVARLTGLPYSFTAHARDLLQIPGRSLATRARAATAVVTCCQANADYIIDTVPAAELPRLEVIRHGVELASFRPALGSAPGPATGPAWPDGASRVELMSVGRLVEKKGFADLLHALARLRDGGTDFRCRIFGDGPLHGELTGLRDALGLGGRVELMGARSSEQVRAALADTDIFVLTPLVTADGDRDGIPNVLVEAMACGLPVVTTSAGGVSELVRHEQNGLMTRPGDLAGVTGSLERLATEPALCARLGRAARAAVERDYDVDEAARSLEVLLVPAGVAPAGVASVGVVA